MNCQHWDGPRRRYCLAPGARRYITGHRCPRHTPAALAGRPEPGTPPPQIRKESPRGVVQDRRQLAHAPEDRQGR